MINILFEGRFIYNYDNYKMVIFVLLYFFLVEELMLSV